MIILCLGICLSGCEKVTEKPTFEKLTQEREQDEAGIISIQPEVTGGRLMVMGQFDKILVYFDYAGKKFIPLCAKADCSHTPGDMTCTANLLAQNLCGICEYQGNLWYLKEVTEGREYVSDPASVTLCRADLTGEKEEELYTWEMEILGTSVVYDGYFYCVDTKECFDESFQFIGFTERLIRIDLKSGDIMEIEEKEEAQLRLFNILGCEKGKLYYQCYSSAKHPDGAVMVYDCDSQDKEIFPLDEGELRIADLDEGYLTYSIINHEQTIMYIVDLESKEDIMSLPIDVYDSYSISGEEVWIGQYHQEQKIYNFKTGEYRELAGRSDFDRGFSTGDGYVGRMVDENGYLTEYTYISKEDYESGKEPTIITKDEYPIW